MMNIRNLNFFLPLVFGVLFCFISCGSDDTEDELVGNWTNLGDFDGPQRGDASGFVIGDAAYICLGYNGKYLQDLWCYDVANKSWKPKKNFPGVARNDATAFSANGKAYVGLGHAQGGTTIFKDFYEYDPVTDEWTQIEDFPGAARYAAIGATVNNTGIVGTGKDESYDYKDFYAFTPGSTPGSGTWRALSSYEGSRRYAASCFVINNSLYVFGGLSNSGNPTDMQKYDLSADKWEKVLDLRNTDLTTDDDKYDNIPRAYASTFVVNGKGYVTLGLKSSLLSSTYEYDASTNKWTERTPFSRVTRSGAVAFSLSETSQSRAFVLSGRNGVGAYYYDFCEFTPTAANNTYDD